MKVTEIFETPEASGFDRVTGDTEDDNLPEGILVTEERLGTPQNTPDTDFTKHLLKSNDMLNTPDTEWEKGFDGWANNVVEHESERKWIKNFIKSLLTSQKEQMKRVVEGVKEKYSRRELQEGGYSQACDDIISKLNEI
jgi:hypothetical protein